MDTDITLPACVERGAPAGEADACVVFLHGLGATGHDFVPLLPYLQLPAQSHIRFVFPHAPRIPVTINGGVRMPAWYDIRHSDFGRADRTDVSGLHRSARMVRGLVEREKLDGVRPERIVLAGFSQGAALALHCALRYPHRLAGLAVLSGYMLLRDSFDAERSDANQDLPIVQHHGTEDLVVPEPRGREAHDTLVDHGYDARYETWPIEHNVCVEEFHALGAWLQKVLPPQAR